MVFIPCIKNKVDLIVPFKSKVLHSFDNMLCRTCGNEMTAVETCPHCNESIHWKCSICFKENEKSVHRHYMEEQNLFKKASETAGVAMITFVSGLSSLILIA
jgi:predicted RNA-binding Zn-ribbon protein involved in translation (DUF1610 family)